MATLTLQAIDSAAQGSKATLREHPRPPEPGKEQEAALGPCARRLAKSLICVSLLLASAAATADNPPVTTQIVDLANKLNGVHPGFRAFHAKGVVLEGSFKASAHAARLNTAPPFSAPPHPLTP